MKFSKFAKDHFAEALFIVLIAVCFYIYFVVYETHSRIYWYKTMIHDMGYVVNTYVVHRVHTVLHLVRHHLWYR